MSLLLLLPLLLGCTPRAAPEEGPAVEATAQLPGRAGDGGVADDPGVPDNQAPREGNQGEEADPEEPPLMEDASSLIVYPDGALRRVYPEDYQLGPLVTAETRGLSVETARRFLRAVVAREVPPDLILPESRFLVLETLGREGWPEIDGFRLGEPIEMADGVVAVPVVLFSGALRGATEVYIEYAGDMWYISEFPVFPGMFDRDDGAIRPQGLFDPRSPQL